jgi:N-acetyl-gamma-glutamyl-phosphate reductase
MITFTPHLVPLSYGELVSCYVTPARAVDAAALYRDAYAGEPWVEVVDGPPGDAGGARDQLLPHLRPRRRADGQLIVFATIDNLYKGTSSQAVQNLNLMFGLDESEGLA